jgi:hypothetical protein
VIRVVNVASFGNCGLSSSAQAKDPPKSGKDLNTNEFEIAVIDRNIIDLIHPDFIFFSSLL